MRRSHALLALSATLAIALLAGGCGELPRAQMSDPAVFTMLHLRAAQSSLATDSGRPASVLYDMDRYFRSKTSQYNDNKLRMDEMLDAHQRRSALAQAVAASLAVKLKITADPASAAAGLAGSGDPKPPASPGGATAATSSADTPTDNAAGDKKDDKPEGKKETPELAAERNALLAKLNEQMKQLIDQADVADSPFDTLDRANDFYTALLIKSLRSYGIDSRGLPPEQLFNVWEAYETLQIARAGLRDAETDALAAEEQTKQSPKAPAGPSGPKLPGSDALFDTIRQLLLPAAKPQPVTTPSTPPSGVPTVADGGATATYVPATTPSPGPSSASMGGPLAVRGVPPQPLPGLGGPLTGTSAIHAESTTTTTSASIRDLRDPRSVSFPAPPPGPTIQIDKDAKPAQIVIDQKGVEAWAKAYGEVEKARIESEGKGRSGMIDERKVLLDRLTVLADRIDNPPKPDDSPNPSALAGNPPPKTGEPSSSGGSVPPPGTNSANSGGDDPVKVAKENVKKAIVTYNTSVATARLKAFETPNAADGRVIMLVLQTHVHPGVGPNRMVGMRARITEFTYEGQTIGTPVCYENGNNPIKVIRLHPTRNYDLEDQLFAESISEQLSANIAGNFGSNVDGDIAGDLATESAARRKFLTRIPKVCSYADAGTAEFGWNFYPSNLVLNKRPPAERILGLVYAPAATQYKIDAFLEGGARDCAVYLVVPTNLDSFKLQVDHVVADLDPESGETRYISTVAAGRAVAGRAHPTAFTVTLPDFNQREWAASLGVKTGTIGSAGPIAVQMMMPPNADAGGPAKNK